MSWKFTHSGKVRDIYENDELNLVALVATDRVSAFDKVLPGDGIPGKGIALTAISNYYNKTNPPTEHTKECVKRALNGEDYSNGALFYYAPKYCGGSTAAWFESLTFCMELEGQRFFK